ncbi:LysR family transcriptional regulator [Thalassovita sp.]|uniref:LysR family transcriptional regulator n=1 Tax=Thalassovita sp. TaxID=1979401 RepID=UPI0029DE5C3F|nr:LysR family transcriptional regulator [Thalassovita sp.]
MHSANWDDLRFVLAVVKHGSLSAAARALKVNHATVLRRIAAFEDQNGGPVFARGPQGYSILPDRLRVIEAAREVENAYQTVERLMRGGRAQLHGVVRVSSTDTMCTTVLPGFVTQMNRRSRRLHIDLLCNNNHLDFSRLQADIAVRPALALPEDMEGEVAAQMVFGVYARPEAPEKWLGLAGPLMRSAPAKWLGDAIAQEDMVGSADSFVVLARMAQQGMGRAVLPCLLGDNADGLRPVSQAMPPMRVPLWVASHAELGHVPRIREVRTRLIRYLAKTMPG